MTHKDRKIQLLTQAFLLLTGFYYLGLNAWRLSTGVWDEGLFEFYNQELPVFIVSAGCIAGLLAVLSFIFLLSNSGWGNGFSLFTTGYLFGYTLMELAGIIFTSPKHAIPMVIILFVVLQTLPFLIRRTQRGF